MRELRTTDGFDGGGDEFYARLTGAHRGLSDSESAALNARLVMLLANHIGDLVIIGQALAAARADIGVGSAGTT